MRKVSVWLQLEPGQQMQGEGIGQHLVHLLAGLKAGGKTQAVVVAPAWAGQTVSDLLCAHGLSNLDLRLLEPRGASWLRPFLIPTTIQRMDGQSGSAEPAIEPRQKRGLGHRALRFTIKPLRSQLRFLRPVVQALRHRLACALKERTYRAMAQVIDEDVTIEGCILPIGVWDTSLLIKKKPIVVQIPDLVFAEFPEYFEGNPDVPLLRKRIEQVAWRAKAITCASEHVRTHHLIGTLGVPPERVFVVPHAPMDLSKALEAQCSREGLVASRSSAITLSKRFQQEELNGSDYVRRLGGAEDWLVAARGANIWDGPIIYCPTQFRPYKNIPRLIEALHLLRRDGGVDASLVLTADLAETGILDLVRSHDLLGAVVPLPRLSQGVHAQFYAAASLAVSASLFEGGMPFTFSEAVSVGTPAILARIPVTEASVPNYLQARMLFDPTNVRDMARVMKEALEDSSLLRAQGEYHSELCRRSWRDVASEYINALSASVPERGE
ncbi:glycosyltransferase [Caulobacter sp. CCUG 60055]|uniref:glycosyltransferase n=2 Tax=Pseudomonadota TaxID=1224 RepID=UPI001FA6F0FA|nr:glycosyltransferase [Caulobacter sp. CCUG 60055]